MPIIDLYPAGYVQFSRIYYSPHPFGFTAAREFGGNPYLGATLGGF